MRSVERAYAAASRISHRSGGAERLASVRGVSASALAFAAAGCIAFCTPYGCWDDMRAQSGFHIVLKY
jgi:hypothetical protein